MSTSVLSLPADVPWKRLAISPDMYAMDINVDFPEEWRSSLAVYSYEPAPDPADTSGEVTTFLKLVTSITGYNAGYYVYEDPDRRQGRFFKGNYFPAYCALAQIAVFPDTGEWDVSQYPYYIDFQPKRREVVESRTATGEVVSQTGEPLKVSKSMTSTQNQGWEYIHPPSGSSYEKSPYLVNNTLSGGNVTETTVTDASREKRETTAYQANLSQLYQLLDTYHTGTNRAVFLTMARPHLVDSFYTFVNGPRRLEGIQDFFLVVRRPAKMTGIRVKAVLETAHLDPSDRSGTNATLFTTARAVSGYMGLGGAHVLPAGPWVVYETSLTTSINDLLSASGQQGVQAVAASNALSRAVKDMVVASFHTGARYPLGTVDFLHTNFTMRNLMANIPRQVIESNPEVLSAMQKVEATLATPPPQLSKQHLAERTRLLNAVGATPTPPDRSVGDGRERRS